MQFALARTFNQSTKAIGQIALNLLLPAAAVN
jgi:hypothetical protein